MPNYLTSPDYSTMGFGGDIPSTFDMTGYLSGLQKNRDSRLTGVDNIINDQTGLHDAEVAALAQRNMADAQNLQSYYDALNNSMYARQGRGQVGSTVQANDFAGAGAGFTQGAYGNIANQQGAIDQYKMALQQKGQGLTNLAINGDSLAGAPANTALAGYGATTAGIGQGDQMAYDFNQQMLPYRNALSTMIGGSANALANYANNYYSQPPVSTYQNRTPVQRGSVSNSGISDQPVGYPSGSQNPNLW